MRQHWDLSTCNCHSKSLINSHLFQILHDSSLRMPIQPSLRHHQLLRYADGLFPLCICLQQPFLKQQKSMWKNGQHQRYQIHFLNVLETQKSRLSNDWYENVLFFRLKFCARKLGAQRPKPIDHMAY